MTSQNFTTTFLVDRTPHEVFAAINNVRGWWSEEIEGVTDTLGAEFAYRYRDTHRCRMKVIEMIPGKRVVWRVLDNYFDFIDDQTEWKDTEIIFEISQESDMTAVRFTHVGLVPAYECFDVCSNAWSSYINGSLRQLIIAGKGAPNRKEQREGVTASR